MGVKLELIPYSPLCPAEVSASLLLVCTRTLAFIGLDSVCWLGVPQRGVPHGN